MLMKKTRTRIVVALIPGIVLFLSGGVAQAQLEQLEITPAEMVKIGQPKSFDNFEAESLEIKQPETLNTFEAKSLESGGFDSEGFNPPKRDNPAYDRCAKQEGFDAQLKCAQEAVGIAPE
jgi:hypothetical protein